MQLSPLSEGSVMDPFSAMLAFASTILNLLCLGPAEYYYDEEPPAPLYGPGD